MREKVGKARSTVFFQWFEAPEGRKVGSLKRRVRSQLARWEMKKCTPLWHEAHLQVKMCKTPGSRSTFGSWDVEKVYAVVARSTLASQNVQSTPGADHFWQLRCRKSARRCGAKHISKWTCTKHTILGPLLEVAMSKKCTWVARSTFRSENVQSTPFSDHFWKLRCRKSARVWREAHFEVKMYKAHHSRTTFGSCDVEKVHVCGAKHISKWKCTKHYTTCSLHFWRFRCRFAWQAQRIVHLVKSEQNVRVFQKRWQVWGIWRGSSKMHFAWQVQYQRHVHQRCSEVRALISWGFLKWFCVTGAARRMTWHQFFLGRRSTLHRWSGKIAKRIGTRLPVLHSTFHFWRKSRRIALFLTLLSSNIEEVSQNCCGFGRC